MKSQWDIMKNGIQISAKYIIDMQGYLNIMAKSQKALKHSASSMFTVSSFYKEIMDLYNHIEHSESEVSKEQLEKLMDIVEDFIESKEYNTDILENWIKENEDFLTKYEGMFGFTSKTDCFEGKDIM